MPDLDEVDKEDQRMRNLGGHSMGRSVGRSHARDSSIASAYSSSTRRDGSLKTDKEFQMALWQRDGHNLAVVGSARPIHRFLLCALTHFNLKRLLMVVRGTWLDLGKSVYRYRTPSHHTRDLRCRDARSGVVGALGSRGLRCSHSPGRRIDGGRFAGAHSFKPRREAHS
jgi:hypothetical protein